MTLPKTGPIKMSQVRTELKLSGAISLGNAKVRALAGKKTGPISLSNLLGKSAAREILDIYVDVVEAKAGLNNFWRGYYDNTTAKFGTINYNSLLTLHETNGVRKTINILGFGIYSSKSSGFKPRKYYFKISPSSKPEWNPSDVPTVLYVRMLNPLTNKWTGWGTLPKSSASIIYSNRSESAAGLKDIQNQIPSLLNKKVRFQLKMPSGYKFVN